ncbi:S24 family peptidase [Pseudomonas sp. abacavir_1]
MKVFSLLNMDFSDRVRDRMKALKLSSVELAQLVGVSKGSVTHWTTGTNQASGKRLIALANALECSAEWLATGDATAPAQTSEPAANDPKPAKSAAATMVLDMLKKHAGKSLNEAAQQRIAQAVAESLAEAPAPQGGGNVIVGDFSRPVGLVGDEIRIARYDIRGAMGGGQVPADYAEMLRDVKVSQQHLRELGVTYDDPNHLKMVHGWGQSMEPTIKHRDPLIVDISIQQFTGDGIYLFTWQGHLYIKRLQVQDADHFEMISDNKQHKDRTIRMDETYIHARVLLVWNAHLV